MKEYDAIEIAFKNGYKKAVKDVFEEIEEACVIKYGNSRIFSEESFAELKKKYTEDKNV